MSEMLETIESALPKKRLLKPVDVALAFDVTRATVYAWADEGLIEGINVGTTAKRRSLIISRDSVLRMVEERAI